jgi:hypothetical protein
VSEAARLAGTTALGALAGAAVGALLFGTPGAWAGSLAAGAAAGGAAAHARRRERRREALLAAPFPERWRRFLLEASDHYERLPARERALFEQAVRSFLADTPVTGVEVEVTDEHRLLVAASAASLSLAWPAFRWTQVTEVLLYPQDFDRDYSFENAELAGQAHGWGTLILSLPALEESFETSDDAYHVGYHEFAHLLDVEATHFDGIPAGMTAARAEEWVALAAREMKRLERGRSVIDDYGADDPVEFWPVAVEAFFEVPQPLRRHHAEVYAVLAEYFGQDPAAWDDARGLRE